MAQRLYEAGLLTYMRTDSVIFLKTMEAAQAEISNRYGRFSKTSNFVNKSKAQESRDISPTDMSVIR
jgi:DNA topoisomerase-1